MIFEQRNSMNLQYDTIHSTTEICYKQSILDNNKGSNTVSLFLNESRMETCNAIILADFHQWHVVWHTENLIIGASRNWCRTVLEWNLAANSALEPHTDGGCTECLGALTIDGDQVVYNPAYYIIAHAKQSSFPDE